MIHCIIEYGEAEKEVLKTIALGLNENVERRKKSTIISIIMTVICVIMCIIALLLGKIVLAVVVFICFGFYGWYSLCGARRFQERNIRKAMSKMDEATISGKREYYFDSEGVRIISALQDGVSYWNSFKTYGEILHYIYILRVDSKVILLDKEKLSLEELNELQGLLQEKCIRGTSVLQ